MRARWLFVSFMLLSVALVVACGGGEDKESGGGATSAGGPGTEVKVTLKEWTLTPEPMSAPSGNVTFAATNSGTFKHELVVIKTDLAPDALKLSGNKVDEDASGDEKGEIDEFDPGKTERKTFNLQPGKYVLICNIPDHYQRGLRSAFTVQ